MVQSGDAHSDPFLSGQWFEHVPDFSTEVGIFDCHGDCRIAFRLSG